MSHWHWNPQDYVRHSAGQARWAEELLARLELRSDERVLDIGCGDGRITAMIARQVPNGQAMGVDVSASMIEHARHTHPASQYPNLTFEVADAAELKFKSQFTLVFSNAALHWVHDHPRVLRGISQALQEGGRCLLQMGGQGNGDDVIAAFEHALQSLGLAASGIQEASLYSFHAPEPYRLWLAAAGLETVRVELLTKDMVHANRAAFVGWLRTAWHPYTALVEAAMRADLIEATATHYLQAHPADTEGQVHVAMVRLEVEAYKPSAA